MSLLPSRFSLLVFRVLRHRSAASIPDAVRAGDGNDASFKNVQVIISDHDLAPDIDGIQNVWIHQVGCGTANVNFRP